jgi:diguanylate cyclase (GGDEF)-like protein
MIDKADNGRELPAEFHRATVDSMFGDARSLGIGTFAAASVATFVSIWMGALSIGLIAALLLVVGAVRLRWMQLYKLRLSEAPSPSQLRRWESVYVLGAASHVLLLGLFCYVTFHSTHDSFARLASFATWMAYLIGIPGRNYGSNRLVTILIVCAALPVVLALIQSGREYWVIVLFVLAPFFSAMQLISLRLRGVLLDAATRARDISHIATQFDSALNNMPSGLAMLNPWGRVEVVNRKLIELLALPSDVANSYASLDDLLVDAVRAGALSHATAKQIVDNVHQHIRGDTFQEMLIELDSGQILDMSLTKMADGGAVLLFDDVTERNRAQARINELARFDPLTGLPNRVEFRERAALLLNQKSDDLDAAMMFVDLDQFKQVNDTLGHAVGDQLLSAAAERLRIAVQPEVLVARMGGDEFVVFMGAVDSLARIEAVARAIVNEMARPFLIGEQQLRLGASVGIARASDVGRDLGVLLRCADMALYQAKSDGRGTWRLFEPRMETRARARRELEFDLRVALETEIMQLHFQPIYHVGKRRFIGCEALLRWRHPMRGMVPPSVFVPIAEEIGVIGKLDDYVLRKACVTAANWPEDISIAINLSAVSFENAEIVGRIKNALALSRLSPQRLEIEITETALLRNMQLTRAILFELRKLGVRISLDDFGTGYSSLSYLHSLPLNKIKIDRSFLAGLEPNSPALKLLTGVAHMSKDLGLTIVVEGVETQEQFQLVTESTEVDEIQGYLFSQPVPEAEIAEIFAKEHRSAA